jgi:hypothetical protein
MGISIKVLNSVNEFSKIKKLISEKISKEMAKSILPMITELKEVTPIDTGLARASWKVSPIVEDAVNITNDVPYIEQLNSGSSKQAPAYFIEKVALKYGTPNGVIVETHKS